MWIKNLVGDVDNAALPLLVMSSHVVRQCRLAARDLEKELVTVTDLPYDDDYERFDMIVMMITLLTHIKQLAQ